MSRLQERFRKGGKGFIPFLVAGDPDLKTSRDLILALSTLQPVAIEIGVPFSDPTADGPVIQAAGQRSLERGTTLSAILEMLRGMRAAALAPVVLFGYYNPILQIGLDEFVSRTAAAGVAAVLVVDLPAEAAASLQKKLRQKKIDLIFLIAPTTSDARLQAIVRRASGFIYAVARTGVTGNPREVVDESKQLVRRIRAATKLPIAVGFGIASRARAQRVWRYADAAVVGSRLVAEIADGKKLNRAALVRRVLKCAKQFA